MVHDFHSHTVYSDGHLTPLELIRRAVVNGYRTIALTDHVGLASLEQVIASLKVDCALARNHWDIVAIPGVELTHVPPKAIGDTAGRAKALGAGIVLVHGETIVEPTERGTNLAAIQCPDVDILAHPGLLTLEEAHLAARNGKFLEITARAGHSLANGYIASMALKSGCRLLVNSDSHDESDLLTKQFALDIARGAGIALSDCNEVLESNPALLLGKLPTGI